MIVKKKEKKIHINTNSINIKMFYLRELLSTSCMCVFVC